MARPTIRAAIPNISEPIGYDKTGEPIYLPEPWRKFLELVSDALFFQGGDVTQGISEGGVELGAGTIGDYVEGVTGINGVTVTGGSGEGSNPVVQIGQPVGTSDSPQFAGVNIGHASDTTVTRPSAGNIAVEGNTVWHAGNDGAASGLDADLLDGQQGGYYLDRANHTGSQAISTVTGLQTELDGKVTKDASITAASETHALNATFDDTEVEAALNALGAVINELRTAFNA